MEHAKPAALRTNLRGQKLLSSPIWNKGTAFNEQERLELGLLGLLPPHIDSLEEQVTRVYEAFRSKHDDLEKHIFLRNLQDQNETLFYQCVLKHIAEMMPIIYTPIVGQACQQFSHIYRNPRGLIIPYPSRDHIDTILDNRPNPEVDVIVVTDGERILGLGDQGVGGMGIPIGKLSLYTAIGGIHPARTLPVLLDAGTNNQERLSDPLYMGWRHERIRGQDYEDFVEAFVAAVQRKLPNVLLQWEDFATPDAEAILHRYRDRLLTFNDDIQGTAAVTTGTIMAAVARAGGKMAEQRVCVLGAGSAGCGVSEQLVQAMVLDGVSEAEARSRFYLVDIGGLLVEGQPGLQPFQAPLAQKPSHLSGWNLAGNATPQFAEVVHHVKPTILIGLTGHAGSFPENIIREMAAQVERPIIFPLSNPTSHVEARPEQLLAWTEGKAIIATGSPFEPVSYNGKSIPIAQCNNAYIFPGLGLGLLAVGATRVTETMFMAAAVALQAASTASTAPEDALLPPLETIRELSRQIAIAVGQKARAEGLARETDTPIEALVEQHWWDPAYIPLVGN